MTSNFKDQHKQTLSLHTTVLDEISFILRISPRIGYFGPQLNLTFQSFLALATEASSIAGRIPNRNQENKFYLWLLRPEITSKFSELVSSSLKEGV